MAITLEGEVEVVRTDELLDVNPANIRTKKILLDLLSDPKSVKAAFAVFEAALIHDNISQKKIAGSGETYGHVNDQEQEITGNKLFQNQAHGGDFIKTFSASATFDADDGNNQYMEVTASTTIAIINEQPGMYEFELEINSGASPTITISASLGTITDNAATLINADNDINLITLYVNPNGSKRYTVEIVTA